jgi:thioredoxin
MYYLKFLFFALPLFATSCSVATDSSQPQTSLTLTEVVQESSPKVKNVNSAQFLALTKKGNGIILDVRTPGETAQGSLANASFINVNDRAFVQRINLIQKDKPIYVYCASGARSAKAADLLLKNGFTEVYNLLGGIRDWRASGYAVTQPNPGAMNKEASLSLTDFEKILDTDKPVLIDFHTQWCAPCKKMNPIVDNLITVNKNQADILKVDVDQSNEIGEMLQIKGVPVFILFKEGKEIWRHSGAISQETLQNVLNNSI